MGRFAAIESRQINRTFQGTHCHVQIKQISMNKAISMNKQISLICAAKGVIIGQLLISIVGFGALFELFSATFSMKHFWAVLLVLLALAFLTAKLLAYLERHIAYYAARRSICFIIGKRKISR